MTIYHYRIIIIIVIIISEKGRFQVKRQENSVMNIHWNSLWVFFSSQHDSMKWILIPSDTSIIIIVSTVRKTTGPFVYRAANRNSLWRQIHIFFSSKAYNERTSLNRGWWWACTRFYILNIHIQWVFLSFYMKHFLLVFSPNYVSLLCTASGISSCCPYISTFTLVMTLSTEVIVPGFWVSVGE